MFFYLLDFFLIDMFYFGSRQPFNAGQKIAHVFLAMRGLKQKKPIVASSHSHSPTPSM